MEIKKVLNGKYRGKDEIPFGIKSCLVGMKVDLRSVLCCMLYLESV